jgi:nucleoside-diphosphate-sugar epimerase
MSRITVFGGRGYIGRHLVSKLRAEGHIVDVPEWRQSYAPGANLGYVVYAIGLTADFRRRPFDTVNAHITMLSQLLHASEFDSLLYLSSTRVYGRCHVTDEEAPIVVQSSDPSDLYNLSKLMGESLALNCGRQGVRIARLSNVVGGLQPSDSFLSRLVQEAKSGEICLQTSLESEKDYIHVDDAVKMLGTVLIKGTQSIYNIASGIQTSNGEWVDLLCEKFRCKVQVNPAAPDISFPRIQISRFIEEFSFQPGSAVKAIMES